MVGTIAGMFVLIRAVATQLYYSHCILPHCHTFTALKKKKKKPVSINNAFYEYFYFNEDFKNSFYFNENGNY